MYVCKATKELTYSMCSANEEESVAGNIGQQRVTTVAGDKCRAQTVRKANYTQRQATMATTTKGNSSENKQRQWQH